jgi:hypothetical protein
MTTIRFLFTTALIFLTLSSTAQAATGRTNDGRDRLFQERTYQGKPLTFWLKVLRDRENDKISSAFDAIYSLGNDAWIAVPDLTQLVAAPFDPIQIGVDSNDVVASKLYDIAVRTEAIEALAWIGEPAAPSTTTLVKWGLMKRISPRMKRSDENDELYIELVAMDTEQKMRVAGAIARFGKDSLSIIARMLASEDASARKLAVAILSQDALPVATELLRSDKCDDRHLGLQILRDMDLVVTRTYIDELARRVGENCSTLTKLQ